MISSDLFSPTADSLESRGGMWTAREIAQQPQMWLRVEKVLAAERAALLQFIAPIVDDPAGRIVLTGAGTSAFIGQCLQPALSERLRCRVDAIPTTDVVSAPQLWLKSAVPTLLVSFARSGNSPESVATLDLAEQLLGNVRHLVVTCNKDGELAVRARKMRNAHLVLLPEATNDRGFAMTSSFTCMLLAAALAFDAIQPATVARLARSAEVLLQQMPTCAQQLVASRFERVIYLGSNELLGLAHEAALKLLELTDGRIATLAESTLGFRHGPKSMVDGKTLVVVMLSNAAYTRAYDMDLLEELRRDGQAGGILALSGHADGRLPGEHLLFAGMDGASDIELSLLHVIVAQCYAFAESLARGLRPDVPNAAGVVNRVVQGVTIYPWQEQGEDVSRR
ncbi:MAG TPA: SIS domain-containing protein [Steroidobacteraceae bacterium]|nr:SIS domain-containing protein [Steroidobacteraceae bacterium]